MQNSKLTLIVLGIMLTLAGCSSSTSDTTAPATTTTTTTASASEASDVVEPDTTPEEDVALAEDASTASEGDVLSSAVAAADALIALLSDDQVDTLSYEYGDTTITSLWSNLPACDNRGRAGIRHGDLTDEQATAVLAVVDAVLSDEGFTNYTQIIAADEELGGGDGDVWDADCYYMAFFGAPSTSEPWAMQFGGHHYARTVDFAAGEIAVTPAFTGVEPRSFTLDGETVAPLAAKSQSIFAIFDTLDDTQLDNAELDRALTEILLGPGADSFPATEGLLLDDASVETQEAVLTAVGEWVNDFDADVAAGIMASAEADLGSTTISWSTSTDTDTQDAYARIDGPQVWIEFINEGGVGSGEIHEHSVYRDKSSDYGTAA